MRHSYIILMILFLTSLSKNSYSNQTNRIKFINLERFSLDKHEYNLNDTIEKKGRIVLDYKSAGRFSINYGIDSLTKTESVKYMIEGFDNYWISDNGCNRIMITNLMAGRYLIKIGIFDENKIVEKKTIDLLITPAVWKTWWFKFIMTTGLFGILIVTIIFLIISNIRLRNKLNK